MTNKNLLLPHEIIFGTYLVITLIRLIYSAGVANIHSILFIIYILCIPLVIWQNRVWENKFTWRVRLLLYPVIMGITFQHMATAVPIIEPFLKDSLLQTTDKMIIGGNLSIMIEPYINRPLTEVISLCYFIFIPYLYLSLIWYFIGDIELCKKFYIGLFSIYGLGFIGYTLIPR